MEERERGVECLQLGLEIGNMGPMGSLFISFPLCVCVCVCVKTGPFGFVVLAVLPAAPLLLLHTHTRRIREETPTVKVEQKPEFFVFPSKEG